MAGRSNYGKTLYFLTGAVELIWFSGFGPASSGIRLAFDSVVRALRLRSWLWPVPSPPAGPAGV